MRPEQFQQNSRSPAPHPRHPIQILYAGIVFLVGSLLASAIQLLLNTNFNPRTTILWQFGQTDPYIFWPLVAFCVVIGILGWILDRAYQRHQRIQGQVAITFSSESAIKIPLARDMPREAFKLGDNAAAAFPYLTKPIQECYEWAAGALRDATYALPSSKRGILITGETNTGKTRLGFEVMRQILPDWYVLVWRPEDHLSDFESFKDQRLVVFLDDLQEHVPTEVMNDRGVVQALDLRAQQLKSMLLTLRASAAQTLVIATCRMEDEARVKARLSWLFVELETVRLPVFPTDVHHEITSGILEDFAQAGARHLDEWDGTLGSLVLGLVAKNANYLRLLQEHHPAADVVRAMKLLDLIGIERHTFLRLRTMVAYIFHREAILYDEALWDLTLTTLHQMQLTTEIIGKDAVPQLVIRKDVYFERVITGYPEPTRPAQLEEHLQRMRIGMRLRHDIEALLYLGNFMYRHHQDNLALEIYVEVVNIDPHYAAGWRNQGSVLFRMGQHESALAALDRAIAEDPNSAAPLRDRGDILRSLRHPTAAEAAYRQALAIDDRYAYAWNGLGNALSDQRRYDEAIDAYDCAIAINPRISYAWRTRGDALVSSRRRFLAALESYDRALMLTPDDLFARVGRGNVLSELHRYAEAERDCARALELRPDYAPIWRNRGNILRGEGKFNEALSAYDQAIALDPGYAAPWRGKGETLRILKRYSDALTAFQNALRLQATYDRAWMGLGVLYIDQRRDTKALAAFQRASELNPTYAAPHRGRGDVFNAQRHYDLALAAYSRAIELEPEHSMAWSGMGDVLSNLGQIDAAFDAFARAIQIDADNIYALTGLSYLLIQRGDLDQAEVICKRAMLIQPPYAPVWRNLGNIARARDRLGDALRFYDEALAIDHHLPSALRNKGEIFALLKMPDVARTWIHQALKYDAGYTRAWVSLSKLEQEYGQPQAALTAIEQAITLGDATFEIWQLHGDLCNTLGLFDTAAASFERAAQLKRVDQGSTTEPTSTQPSQPQSQRSQTSSAPRQLRDDRQPRQLPENIQHPTTAIGESGDIEEIPPHDRVNPSELESA